MLKLLLVLISAGLVAIAIRVATGLETGEFLKRRVGSIFCRFSGHRRGGVSKVENIYLSRCKRCGVKLAKTSREASWAELRAGTTAAPNAYGTNPGGEGYVVPIEPAAEGSPQPGP